MHEAVPEMQWAFSEQLMDLDYCPNDVDMLCCIEPAAASVYLYKESHLEVVDQTVVPNFDVHTQIIMSINLLSAQNELQSLIDSCIFALGRGCELFLTVDCHLHCSASHTSTHVYCLSCACASSNVQRYNQMCFSCGTHAQYDKLCTWVHFCIVDPGYKNWGVAFVLQVAIQRLFEERW